jgi:hypothetical protein
MLSCCLLLRQGVIACAGGISFGYEGPVVSGLIINPAFLQVFDDHSGNIHELAVQSSSYCKLNSPALQMYISCSFITAALATAAAATWADRCVHSQGNSASILSPSCLLCEQLCSSCTCTSTDDQLDMHQNELQQRSDVANPKT